MKKNLIMLMIIIAATVAITIGVGTTAQAITGGSISGTVTNATDQPLQGVTVNIYQCDDVDHCVAASTTTDQYGRYTVDGLADSTYKVGFTDTGYQSQYYNNESSIDAANLVSVSSGSDAGGVDATMTAGVNCGIVTFTTPSNTPSSESVHVGETVNIAGSLSGEGSLRGNLSWSPGWFDVLSNFNMAIAPPSTPGVYHVDFKDGSDPSCTVYSVNVTVLPRDYIWTWYDNLGGDNWILMSNPAHAVASLNFQLSIAGSGKTLPNGGAVGPGQTIAPRYGTMGGPVVATSITGDKGIVSQRSLWPKGGNSLEEVLGTDESQLSSDFYWTWYDQQSPGMTDWVLVANPSSRAVYYEITIAGQAPGTQCDINEGNYPSNCSSGYIAGGTNITPSFPAKIGGPVEVQAWTDNSKTTPVNIMASQRVLSNDGKAFNEVPGIPASQLSGHYYWTWYDQKSSGMADWVLVANPSATDDVYYQIKVAGQVMPQAKDNPGVIDPGKSVTPRFDRLIGDPVELTSCSQAFDQSGNCPGTSPNVIASQRSTTPKSFEEVPGYPAASLAGDYNWTWYDGKNSANWVLVANPSATDDVYYQVSIAGQVMPQAKDNPGVIAPGKNVTPMFDGTMNGPVEVRSCSQAFSPNGSCPGTTPNLIASQRVLWNGYFNEVLGTTLR